MKIKKFNEDPIQIPRPFIDGSEEFKNRETKSWWAEKMPKDYFENFRFLIYHFEDVPISFMAGPEDQIYPGGDQISSYFSCYEWMKMALKDVKPPKGMKLDIGASENTHYVKLTNHDDLDEDDPVAVQYAKDCIDRLVSLGGILS